MKRIAHWRGTTLSAAALPGIASAACDISRDHS
jgi:hypothetical protein